MKFAKYLNESPAFKTGAMQVQGQPKPSIQTAQLATDLFVVFDKTYKKLNAVPEELKGTFKDALNHIYLAYELIRKRYPLFFRKLD
jgi:hypothetical protein